MALWSKWKRQRPQKTRFVGSNPTGATKIAVCVYGRIADENLCTAGGNACHIYGRHPPHEAGMHQRNKPHVNDLRYMKIGAIERHIRVDRAHSIGFLVPGKLYRRCGRTGKYKGGERLQSNTTLWQGDCLELMKDIPDGSVDLVLTDPPYKMNHSTGGCTNIGMKNKWQGNIKAGNTIMGFDLSIKFSGWLPEAYRVLKPSGHCYIFCNDKNLQELLNVATGVGFRESNLLVWIKNNATPNRYYMKNCEFIVFLYKGLAKPINDMGSKCCTSINNINGKNKLHPTEKPVKIITKYILNSSDCGDTILDPFMGSGTTGVACINTGRNFIGIELDEGYFDIAQERIQAAQRR